MSQAVETIHELLGLKNEDLTLKELVSRCRATENWHIWWLLIFFLKTASYFRLLIENGKHPQSEPEIFLKRALKDFLQNDVQKIKQQTIEEYQSYSKKVMKRNDLDKVIERYVNDFEKLFSIVQMQI